MDTLMKKQVFLQQTGSHYIACPPDSFTEDTACINMDNIAKLEICHFIFELALCRDQLLGREKEHSESGISLRARRLLCNNNSIGHIVKRINRKGMKCKGEWN